MTDAEARHNVLRSLLKSLPSAHRVTLAYLFKHLLRVAELGDANKMHLSNLAIVFGPVSWSFPHFLCPPAVLRRGSYRYCLTAQALRRECMSSSYNFCCSFFLSLRGWVVKWVVSVRGVASQVMVSATAIRPKWSDVCRWEKFPVVAIRNDVNAQRRARCSEKEKCVQLREKCCTVTITRTAILRSCDSERNVVNHHEARLISGHRTAKPLCSCPLLSAAYQHLTPLLPTLPCPRHCCGIQSRARTRS